jgi:aspartate/methionine/tyrosine aminotransferase
VYSKLLHLQTPIDPQKEVLVTDGAYEALFCAIMVRWFDAAMLTFY